MRIFNQDKTVELATVDLEKGYLKNDKLVIAHHEAVQEKSVEQIVREIQTQGAVCNLRFDGNWYRQTKVYESGGTEEKQIFPIEAKDAYDEYEDIQVYVLYTEAELKERAAAKSSAELKAELAKIKEDIEQETFGLVRDDYTEKKARAAEIINELRVLEGKEPRKIDYKL